MPTASPVWNFMVPPGLVVFDLDFTLWDCGGLWIDCTSHPFIQTADGGVSDSSGRRFRLYEEAEEILDQLESAEVSLALASRTERPDWAVELLNLWGLEERFLYHEIYPGSKVTHFESLRDRTGIHFREMLFFDDEERNITEVGRLGVHCHHVKNGVSLSLLEAALKSFSKKV
ncbi:MAG: magnesium-dependent phosphatase-1 [Verrucomicrobiales bacterium]|nr:magnesium-dependent phosphatase-1 [Verrucomicrobiales bacterium]